MKAPRVVLDSNVIISAILFNGTPRKVFEHLIKGSIQVFISTTILDEVRDVLQRPKFDLRADQAMSLILEIKELCEIVSPKHRVNVVQSDPDDNAILECAYEARVKYIVSGDQDLLQIKEWQNIKILSPHDFLKIFTTAHPPKNT